VTPSTAVDSLTLQDRSILISGGTGTFGRAFARRALSQGASRVVIFSRSEAKQAAMRAEFNDPRLRWFIGDVRDARRVSEACRGVEFMIHAAALKRIETCEQDPDEAVATNVFGTQNVARACIDRGVRRAVLLSTDKAAAPNTLYGMTKGAAERLWVNSNVYAAGTQTRFSATRYGNVLGSTGSVVELWRRQTENGERLTVTDFEMTRFWMTIAQATRLVSLALNRMRGGEIFIPKVGASSLLDLCCAISPKVATHRVGLRRGEKMHETLIAEDEAEYAYDHGDHFRIEPERSWDGSLGPEAGVKLVRGSVYRSDSSPHRLSIAELREMAA
jgi:UDP-N-acetylglucosamine 4,6-dehydratase